MANRISFLLLLIVTFGLTACSAPEQNGNQATAPVQQVQSANPQPEADNPNVVRAGGQVAVIPQAAQPAVQPAVQPAPVNPDKAPKIELPVKKADFGKVGEDKKIVRDFVVKNVGKAPLNIESVSPG